MSADKERGSCLPARLLLGALRQIVLKLGVRPRGLHLRQIGMSIVQAQIGRHRRDLQPVHLLAEGAVFF